LTEREALQEIAEVENALIDGYPHTPLIGNHKKGCIRIASERLRINDQALRSRTGTPTSIGSIELRYGFKVDWSLYREPEIPEPVPEPPKPEPPPEPPGEPLEYRRLKDEVVRLRTYNANLERDLIEALDIRVGVMGLMSPPLVPQLDLPDKDEVVHHRDGRTAILHLSDVHYGEVVLLEEMDGLNCYNESIAKARIGRFFSTAADLMTKHWKGNPPEEIILCLGGDLISGNLHPELEQTNYPTLPNQIKEVGEHIAGGILLLAERVKCPIRVMVVPGNHGRSTPKPQSKRRSSSSFDLLASDFCEAVLKGTKVRGVTFYRAASPDVYFSVYGWHFMLQHGDSMGSRGGGTGYIGPMAIIIKGHRKLVDTSQRAGKPVHFVLTGHYHTTCKTAFGWGNGSVIAYGEYARDLRADAEPARQNMLIVHPRHGVIEEKPLYLGTPDEGSLYMGPTSIVRPRWTTDGEEA
jgi:hypothetical protein